MKSYIENVAKALYHSTQGKTAREIETMIENSLNMLRSKRLFGQRKQLFPALERVRLEDQNKLAVLVTAKQKLTAAELKLVNDYIKKKHHKRAEVTVMIENNLRGGLKIAFEDTVLDLTIDKQIVKLSNHLHRQTS